MIQRELIIMSCANAKVVMLKINDVVVPQPSTMKYNRIDYDSEDSFRSMSGEMIRDRIATKVKLECTWNYLTQEDAYKLLNAVKCTYFHVQFIDPFENKWVDKVMYVGDRTLPFYNVIDGVIAFTGTSMNFIER